MLSKYTFYHNGNEVTLLHNLSEERIKRLHKRWLWRSGETNPAAFLKHCNSLLLHRLLGLKIYKQLS